MTPIDTRARRTTWAAGLVVAAGAGVATAHGLYEVATSARVPAPVAWLYPLITDGLALVAYAATARLHDTGQRYAAGIVVLAAGLSGLAQAVYLAGGLDHSAVAPVGLRFGVGAWPAIAAALTAHLLHLISTGERPASNRASKPIASNAASTPPVQTRPPEQRPNPPVQSAAAVLDVPAVDVDADPTRPATGSARDRARAAARRHHDAHGALPTATELAELAGTSRGTAGNALKDLRAERRTLHLVNANADDRTTE
jgi:hypothetical protein